MTAWGLALRHITLLLALASAALAAPESYNATSHYGVLSGSNSLLFEPRLTGASLLSETTEVDGRKRLSFDITVSNPAGGYFENVYVGLNFTEGLPWAAEIVPGSGDLGELAPGTNAAPTVATTPLSFLVPAADAEAAKTSILALENPHLTAWDLYRFSAPVRAADATMDAAFFDASSAGNTVTLVFSASTPSLVALTPGMLLVHNPRMFELRGQAFAGETILRQFLTNVETANQTAKETDISTKLLQIGSVTTDPSTGRVTVTGARVDAIELMVSAYTTATQLDGFIGPVLRDPYNPPVGTSFHTLAERSKRIASLASFTVGNPSFRYPPGGASDITGLFTLHYPINDLEITPGVMIDGELLFKGLNLWIDGAERDDQRNKWAYRVSNRFEVTLRLTAEAGVQLADLEKTILNVPLPTVVIPVFQVPITIQPLLKAKVGAALSAGTRIQVPVHCAVDAGFEMTYDGSKPPGSQFEFRPFADPIPMQMSKPSLARAVRMDANAWVEVGLDLLLQNTIGPGIAVRCRHAGRRRHSRRLCWRCSRRAAAEV